MTPRRYRVTSLEASPSATVDAAEVEAYDAADAVAQEMLRLKNCYPPRRVVQVEPAFHEPVFVWRGSAQDLVTDLAVVLTPADLAALSGEVALAGRKKASER